MENNEHEPIIEDQEVFIVQNVDAKKLNRLDRIKAYYLDNNKLDEEDEEYRLTLRKINHWFEQGKSPADARAKLEKEMKLGDDQSSQYVSDALELYGDISQSDREGLRHLLTNHFLRIAQKAERAKDLDLAAKTYERVSRINNLDEVIDPNAKKGGRRIQISYTTNPDALKKAE